ncbi:MAG: serine/threonine-protein kinase, partial [Mycobacteriaceae bacterium]
MAVDGSRARTAESGYLVAGRYRLLRRIGVGGMGAVWLANDQLLSREVAVKQVLSTAGMDEAQAAEQRQRFLREGRIAARLTHPHVIAMHDVALESGEPWLVMEYLPSRSLATVVGAHGTLPVPQVAQIGAQLADALAAAHAAGIVHRDVKPGNVLIADAGRAQGTVKITDFGISRARGDVMLTEAGIITGTAAYLAPEVARGHEPTEASDVFALGSTLFTAVEGAPPFGLDDNAMALLHRVASGAIDHPQRAGELTPSLLWMLEPDPDRRPTMMQARDALAQIAAGRGGDTRSVLSARTSVLPLSGHPETPAAAPPTTAFSRRDAGPSGAQPARVGRLHSRLVWTVVAVVALLAIAGTATTVALANNGTDSSAGAAAPSLAAPSLATAAPSITQPPSSSTTAPTSTVAVQSADSAVGAVRDYYALMPANTAAGWNL